MAAILLNDFKNLLMSGNNFNPASFHELAGIKVTANAIGKFIIKIHFISPDLAVKAEIRNFHFIFGQSGQFNIMRGDNAKSIRTG